MGIPDFMKSLGHIQSTYSYQKINNRYAQLFNHQQVQELKNQQQLEKEKQQQQQDTITSESIPSASSSSEGITIPSTTPTTPITPSTPKSNTKSTTPSSSSSKSNSKKLEYDENLKYYPEIVSNISHQTFKEYDCIYLDVNPIIHNCIRSSQKGNVTKTDESIIKNITETIEDIIFNFKCNKYWFISFDGVSTKSKRLLQRENRARSTRKSNKDIYEYKRDKNGSDDLKNKEIKDEMKDEKDELDESIEVEDEDLIDEEMDEIESDDENIHENIENEKFDEKLIIQDENIIENNENNETIDKLDESINESNEKDKDDEKSSKKRKLNEDEIEFKRSLTVEISPGTNLSKLIYQSLVNLSYHICKRLNIEMFISSTSRPGEGETKIIEHLRFFKQSNHEPKSVLIISQDSDMVLIPLANSDLNSSFYIFIPDSLTFKSDQLFEEIEIINQNNNNNLNNNINSNNNSGEGSESNNNNNNNSEGNSSGEKIKKKIITKTFKEYIIIKSDLNELKDCNNTTPLEGLISMITNHNYHALPNNNLIEIFKHDELSHILHIDTSLEKTFWTSDEPYLKIRKFINEWKIKNPNITDKDINNINLGTIHLKYLNNRIYSYREIKQPYLEFQPFTLSNEFKLDHEYRLYSQNLRKLNDFKLKAPTIDHLNLLKLYDQVDNSIIIPNPNATTFKKKRRSGGGGGNGNNGRGGGDIDYNAFSSLTKTTGNFISSSSSRNKRNRRRKNKNNANTTSSGGSGATAAAGSSESKPTPVNNNSSEDVKKGQKRTLNEESKQ